MKIEINGQNFELLAERVVVWIERKILICSDFHWGREAFLQRHGMAIPEQSFEVESQILIQVANRYSATELWILGDFIHHPQGVHSELLAQIHAWFHGLKFETTIKKIKLVPGNHDRNIKEWGADLPIEILPDGIIENHFAFLHEPVRSPDPNLFYWCGHLHPAVRLGSLFGFEKIPCFYIRERFGFLPAFSRLAGGAEVEKEEPSDRLFVIADHQVIEI